jgi:hypothetical protein
MNFARQLLSIGSDHSRTYLMQPCPCSFVTPQTKKPLQSCSTSARFLSTDPPHGYKPHPERFSGTFENCSRGQRCLMMTGRAFNNVSLVRPPMMVTTTWAPESIRPPLRNQIGSARILSGKASFEFQLSLWKIWKNNILHAPSLS